ncbi:MAG: HNH endonuclease [Planctomycetota bacterium]
MTDQDILDRINDGTLVVQMDKPIVWSFNTRRKVWTPLTAIEHESNGSKYRFVNICKRRMKKKIAVHRLVWMFAHRQLVPEGYDVDHIEGKVSDRIENLQLLESSRNRSKGAYIEDQQEELPF